MAFLVRWVSQLCAFLWEGRQNSFNLSAVIQSCRGNLFNLIVIIFIVYFFSFDLLMVLNYYYHLATTVNTVFCATKNFSFFHCSFVLL